MTQAQICKAEGIELLVFYQNYQWLQLYLYPIPQNIIYLESQ